MRNKRKYIRTTGIILLFCVALLNTACVSKQKEKVVLEPVSYTHLTLPTT